MEGSQQLEVDDNVVNDVDSSFLIALEVSPQLQDNHVVAILMALDFKLGAKVVENF